MRFVHNLMVGLYKKYFRPDALAEMKKLGLVVGDNFHMLGEVIIDYSHCWLITIGNDVTLAPRVHILAHDASTQIPLNFTRVGKVAIGNRVFIGASAIVLPGVTIGDDVIIGAGSVVSHDVPNGVVAAGNPATTLCPIEEFLKRRKKEMGEVPCFGEEFTVERGVTNAMRKEMRQRMKGRFGYVA